MYKRQAGAVILEASEQEGIISTHLHASPDNNAALLLPQAERGVEKSGYIEDVYKRQSHDGLFR